MNLSSVEQKLHGLECGVVVNPTGHEDRRSTLLLSRTLKLEEVLARNQMLAISAVEQMCTPNFGQ